MEYIWSIFGSWLSEQAIETVSDLSLFCISFACIISSGLSVPGILCSSLQASVASYLIFISFSSYFLICISAKNCFRILGGVESVACCEKEQGSLWGFVLHLRIMNGIGNFNVMVKPPSFFASRVTQSSNPQKTTRIVSYWLQCAFILTIKCTKIYFLASFVVNKLSGNIMLLFT